MRQVDKTAVINGEKIPIFLSPFTKEDYHSLIAEYNEFDKFGILDSPQGKIEIYDFEKRHVPNVNYLWNMDFNIFKAIKFLGLGIASYYAYRMATFRPKFPSFDASKDDYGFVSKMSDIFPMANPKIVYNGEGKGYGESEE